MAIVNVRMQIINASSDISVIKDDWQIGGNGPFAAKIRRGDVEHPTIELKMSASAGSVEPTGWTHCAYILDSTKTTTLHTLVYRILSMRQGDAITVPDAANTSSAKSFGTIIFDLELDMLATLHTNTRNRLLPGTYSITGRWSRYPLPSGPLEPFQIRPAQMKRSKSVEMPSNIPTITYRTGGVDHTDDSPLWVQIFVMREWTTGHWWFESYGALCPRSGAVYHAILNDAEVPTPSWQHIMNDPDSVLDGMSIISVSVSRCAPVDFEQVTSSVYPNPSAYHPVDSSGNAKTPVRVGSIPGWNDLYMFQVANENHMDALTLDIPLTDKEKIMGSVRIIDACGTPVGSIDTRYAVTATPTDKISASYRVFGNGIGLLNELTLSDGTLIKWPAGVMPYNTSAYAEYAMAQMKYDREMLAINQEKVYLDTANGIVGAITNGAVATLISGGAGAGTAVGGLATAGASAYMTYKHNEQEQTAKENLMKNTPDTAYITGYGTEYITRIKEGFRDIAAVNMPDGVSDGDLTYYVNRHGYPVTDWYATLSNTDVPSEGYIQGELADVTGSGNPQYGEYRRILEKELSKGIHFKKVS